MSPTDPQKSEIHESTADASTSPSGGADQDATRQAHSAPAPHDDDGRPRIPLDPPKGEMRLIAAAAIGRTRLIDNLPV